MNSKRAKMLRKVSRSMAKDDSNRFKQVYKQLKKLDSRFNHKQKGVAHATKVETALS